MTALVLFYSPTLKHLDPERLLAVVTGPPFIVTLYIIFIVTAVFIYVLYDVKKKPIPLDLFPIMIVVPTVILLTAIIILSLRITPPNPFILVIVLSVIILLMWIMNRTLK